jgi:hypothetical protein
VWPGRIGAGRDQFFEAAVVNRGKRRIERHDWPPANGESTSLGPPCWVLAWRRLSTEARRSLSMAWTIMNAAIEFIGLLLRAQYG